MSERLIDPVHATIEPKEIRWYDAGYELGERSKHDGLPGSAVSSP